jgi:ketosteroid isomerase-like protein
MLGEIERIETLAKTFFDCIETGDLDGVSACYADDVEIWHNTDRTTEDKSRNLKVLKGFTGYMSGIRYTNRRLAAFPGGFVQQHVLCARRPDGVAVELPAAIICAVRDGKITRLDEYFDSAQVATFTGK